MHADPVRTTELAGLTLAFESFTAATVRLEHEYATLRARVTALTAELEEKNRRLAASLERERQLEAAALRQSRLAAMGEMAARLAHEVRNPLGAMELFTGLLLQDLEG
jgi:two-component system sensor histidine kinase FlrB